MLKTELTDKALEIAQKAHEGQVDKAGRPYIEHPIHVAESMETEEEVCVALLHDVIEDTNLTLADIEKEGFPDEVIKALELLTHDDDVPYLDYVRAIAYNPIAKKVKLADLRHNSDLTRLPSITKRDEWRVEKYQQAIGILEQG